jgi:hypothetical protein
MDSGDSSDRLFSPKKTAPSGNRFNFNAFAEIKSHSSLLYNERLAILWYLLDMDSIIMNESYSKDSVLKVKSKLYQIWKNIRTIVRNSIQVRRALNLETKEDGVYTVDVAFDIINKMFIYCENDRKIGFTYQRLYIMADHLNRIELIIRDVLQYFQYFIRAEFKQMPDILQAADNYKKYADKLTIQQLQEIIGKHNKIDFEGLGVVRDFNDYDDDTNKLDDNVSDDDKQIAAAEEALNIDEDEE